MTDNRRATGTGLEMISRVDQQRLLTLARRALEARVRRQPPPLAEHGGELDRPAAPSSPSTVVGSFADVSDESKRTTR